MRDRGLQVHPTTVAKIEAGERAAKIDEIAAIADIFEVSLDRLLGRDISDEADAQHALRALTDTAAQSAWQVTAITNTLRDQTTQLAAFTPTDAATKRLVSECAKAADTLTDVTAALWDALNTPEGFPAGQPSGRPKR
jgi:hypothetical protein